MSNIMEMLGLTQETVNRSAATIAGEMKLLKTGFYTAKVKRVATYKNRFNSISLFVELDIDGDTKSISGSLKNKDGKTAEHIVAMLVEISTAANVDISSHDSETSKGKLKDYGQEHSCTVFDDLTGTTVGLISILSYNAEDDFKFKENLTVCQADGTNAKGDSLKEKLEAKMEDMEEFEGYLATKRNAKKKTSNSKSAEASEASEGTKASASKI